MDITSRTQFNNVSVNLPVETILTLIDIDDKEVEVDINDIVKKFKNNKQNDQKIRTLNTYITANYKETDKRTFEDAILEYDTFTITNIDRKKIENTNEIKFYDIKLEFSTGIIKKFVVPSYVKFYSSHRGLFIPAEYVRNRDILIDYTGNMVKIDDAKLNESFTMTDFYSITVNYDIADFDLNDYQKRLSDSNFYLNGVLTNISYNNFQKKD